MRETEKRIKEYKKALPHLREKLAAATMMLLVSVIVMTASTFAWITLSASPEVSGMTTSVAANGNLEIALSDADGLEPEESQVGDSVASANTSLVDANLTWGNLVNLADPSYGLGNLTLRPAALNQSALESNPLRAAQYGADGRVTSSSSDFEYTNYVAGEREGEGLFRVPDEPQYGVRAISSVTYDFPNADQVVVERYTKANTAWGFAADSLAGTEGLCTTKNINNISGIIGDYASCRLNDSFGTQDFSKHISSMYTLFEPLSKVYTDTASAVAALCTLKLPANSTQEVTVTDVLLTEDEIAAMDAIIEPIEATAKANNTEIVIASAGKNNTTLMNVAKGHIAALKSKYGLEIDGLDQFLYDYYLMHRYYRELETLNNQGKGVKVLWREISHIINFIVDVPTTLVTSSNIPVGSLGASAAGTVLDEKNNLPVKVQYGAMCNLEKFIGKKITITGVKVTVKYLGVNVTATGYITTNVKSEDYQLTKQLEEAREGNLDTENATAYAADTYGMAIDLWVRTNMEDAYLTLEGHAITSSVQKTDEEGNKYYISTESGLEYYLSPDGKYYTTLGEEADVEADSLKEYKIETVEGYEGENRVWDNPLLTDRSTTQGAGSCYIFYADDPAQQAQSLELMKYFSVAFIDETGAILATASMNADKYYAESGRVIVPLELNPDNSVKTEDELGETVYAITKLESGIAKRITAIVYLEGEQLGNSQVLSANGIEGQLNIQFGSNQTLKAITDKELEMEEIHITASLSKDYFADTVAAADRKTTVTLKIDGSVPENVKACFIRRINSAQGTRQEDLIFTKKEGSDTEWIAEAEFAVPGTYVLRTAWLDGVEYKLDQEKTVIVDGFSLVSLNVQDLDEKVENFRTTENYLTKDVSVKFSNNMAPKTVQVIFMNEENQTISADCKYVSAGSTGWEGQVTFPGSGTYEMKYYVVDDQYYQIPEEYQRTVILQMGIHVTASVEPKEFQFDYSSESANAVSLFVNIQDDKGNDLTDLDEVVISYNEMGASNGDFGVSKAYLSWNEGKNAYTGSFTLPAPGEYKFYSLMMDDSIVTRADAENIEAISPDPPSYVGSLVTEEYIFSISGDAKMGVQFKNAPTAKATAVLEQDQTGTKKTITVSASSTDTSTMLSVFNFDIPKDATLDDNGMAIVQSGVWRIKEIKLTNVYDEDGIKRTDENPMIFNVESDDIHLEVSNVIAVETGGIAKSPSGTFLTQGSATGNDVWVKIYTYKGGNEYTIPGISEVNVQYGFDLSAYANNYAADTKTAISGYVAEATLESSDSKTYSLGSKTLVFPYAGTYNPKYLTFRIGDQVYGTTNAPSTMSITGTDGNSKTVQVQKPASINNAFRNMPVYSVTWTTPTVIFSKTDPATNKSFTSGKGKNTYNIIRDSGKTCEVFHKVTAQIFLKFYEASEVYMSISEAGDKFSSASMSFTGNGNRIQTVTYTFTNSKPEVGNAIGTTENLSATRVVFGTGKSSSIAMEGSASVNNGEQTVKYTYVVPEMTIINTQ